MSLREHLEGLGPKERRKFINATPKEDLVELALRVEEGAGFDDLDNFINNLPLATKTKGKMLDQAERLLGHADIKNIELAWDIAIEVYRASSAGDDFDLRSQEQSQRAGGLLLDWSERQVNIKDGNRKEVARILGKIKSERPEDSKLIKRLKDIETILTTNLKMEQMLSNTH